MSKIIRTEYFQLNIPQNVAANQFNFPDAANLRNVHLLGIKVFSDLDLIKTPDGNSLVTSNILGNTFIVLQDYTGKIILNQFPIINFINTSTTIGTGLPGSAFNEQIFTGQRISWPKSYIIFDKANFVAAPLSYYFVVYYSESMAVEKQARKTTFLRRK